VINCSKALLWRRGVEVRLPGIFRDENVLLLWHWNLKFEDVMCQFSVLSTKQGVGVARGFLGWLPRLLYSWKTCAEVLSCCGNDGNSAIWTVWFLNRDSSRLQVFEFCQPNWIYSLFSGEGQVATWPSLLGMTFKLKLYYKFPLLYFSNNSKLRYSQKLTKSLPLSLPSAPDGFYHLMKPDSFFSPSFIVYY